MHFLLLASLAAAAPTTTTFDVPLKRRSLEARSDGSADVNAFVNELNRTLAKYHSQNFVPARYANLGGALQKRQTGTAPLTDQADDSTDELYYYSATIGTSPAQTFTLDGDTGSSDLIVEGPSCGTAQGCTHQPKYAQKGQDEHNTTMIVYGSGEVSGENYFDTVTVAGLTATHQNVVSLTQAQGFSSSDSDGLMGFGFQSIANSGQPPFFQNLVYQKKVSKDEFAFTLGRAKSGTQGNSKLTLGGRPATTKPVASAPVVKQGYWETAIQGLGVDGKIVSGTAGTGAWDTGTTILLAPLPAAQAFALATNAFPIEVSGAIVIYAYPCQYYPRHTITIGVAGKQYKINPLDLNLGQLTPDVIAQLGLPANALTTYLAQNTGLGGLCLSGIAGAELSPTEELYIVGDTAIKNFDWVSFSGSTAALGVSAVNFAQTPAY